MLFIYAFILLIDVSNSFRAYMCLSSRLHNGFVISFYCFLDDLHVTMIVN